ncbi:MAG: type I-E CRISPR-associated endoribonuclease Cas2e [Rhodospirillaceae bacterium]
MPMVVIVARDVPDRFHGFLGSCLVEISPGVYTSPIITSRVRDQIWSVMTDWFAGRGSIVMTWRDPLAPGRQGLATLGIPPRTLVDVDGFLLVKRESGGAVPTI